MAEADTSRVQAMLYLEDLHVGQRFASGTRALNEGEIKAFARQFDPQPFHLDDAAARDTLFAGLAASGWHTAALTMRLLVDSGPPLAGGIIGGGGELAWPKPTRPGDVLRVESEIVDVTPSRSRRDRGMVTMRCETVNQRGEAVQVLTASGAETRAKRERRPSIGAHGVQCPFAGPAAESPSAWGGTCVSSVRYRRTAAQGLDQRLTQTQLACHRAQEPSPKVRLRE